MIVIAYICIYKFYIILWNWSYTILDFFQYFFFSLQCIEISLKHSYSIFVADLCYYTRTKLKGFNLVSDIDQECTIFSGVTYLGAATVNAPKSEGEIQRNIAILHEQCTEQGIKISISVPSSSQGMVV